MSDNAPNKSNIVIVGKVQGFLVKGIESKLNENSLRNQYVDLTIKNIAEGKRKKRIMIDDFFLKEKIEKMKK